MEPVLSPEPKKPPDFLRSSRRSRRAAHAAHVGGLHVGVDIIGEVGRAVFGRHFKQETVVFRGAPVKLFGNGIGRNRVLEAAAVGVAFDHGLDERLVHHFHFFLAVIVGEVHVLAAHDGRHVLHVIGHGPVQGDVGEGSLCAPAGRRVHTVDEGLDALLHFFVIQMVCLYERSQVTIWLQRVLKCLAGAEEMRSGTPPSPSWISCFKLQPAQ